MMPRWIEKIVDYGGSPRTVRGVAGLLLILMLALGMLQYHWIGQLSDAKKSEMEQALQTSSSRFTSEFHRDLIRMYMSVLMNRPFSQVESKDRQAERYRQWAATAMHQKLVKRFLVVEGENLFVLDNDSGEFEAAPWGPDLAAFRDELKLTRERMFRSGGGPLRPPGEPGGGGGGGGFRGMGAGVAESIPALLSPRLQSGKEGDPPQLVGWSALELDLDYLRTELLPDLTHRSFGDNYRVQIVSRANPAKQIFASPGASSVSFAAPDLEVGMFELVPQDMSRFGFGGGGRRPDRGPDRSNDRDKGGKGPRRPMRAEAAPIMAGGGSAGGPRRDEGRQGQWLLQAKHESGSVDVAVQSLRYKNLGIISGILLLMGLTIAAFVASTRRAQQLAQQQMEFVASISHELRTPLTVICSAGDNLAGGVVKTEAQVKRYGTLVRNEGRRLADMVEQILGYAGIQKGRIPTPQPVDVESIVDGALRASQQVLQAKSCQVDSEVAPGLPSVLGDAASLSHCIQNLLTNAAKYGGDAPQIRLRAEAVNGGSRIRITVSDNGPGIEPADLRHIFEPFYRGRKAVDDQIHGTGLGLSLVKRIIEAHNGKVNVESTLGQGSRFTLEVPALSQEASHVSDLATTAVRPEANLT